MRIRGYRGADAAMLRGHWLAGELLAAHLRDVPALAPEVSVALPAGGAERLYIVADSGWVRFSRVDWIARRARLEIGLAPGADRHAGSVLEQAVEVGTGALALRRLFGVLTPAVGAMPEVLAAAGFVAEAEVPRAIWHDGTVLDRQIWGRVP